MKKIYFLVTSLLLLTGFAAQSQCNNGAAFGTAAAPTTNTTPTTITTCAFGGEFSTITGATAGSTYLFNATGGAGNFITIRQGTPGGTVLGFGIYFANLGNRLGTLILPGALGLLLVITAVMKFVSESQQENFGFWFGAHKWGSFEYGFDDWYSYKFLGANREKPESDRAKAKRLMKEQSKRLEFLAFCDRLNSDPEYRKAYMEASKEVGV